jgi:hypothetical protein
MTQDPLTHLIAGLLLLSRLTDIGSTWVATPHLKLEANPLTRRFRWPFALLTLGVAVIPYWSIAAGIVLLVASFLVSAGNFGRAWVMRTIGEDEYQAFMTRLAARANPLLALSCIAASALCMAAVGGVLLLFYPDPQEDWGFYFAFGFFGYALAIALWGSVAFLRMRKAGRSPASPPSSPSASPE